MPRWSYPLTQVRTNQLISEHIPFTGVKFSDSLNNGGTFTASMPAGHPAFSTNVQDDLWRYVVWPCRYGRPMGAFLLVNFPNMDLASTTIPVQGVRADAILNNRELRDDLNFSGVDQLDMARDMLRYGTGVPTMFSGPLVTPDTTVGAAMNLPWLRLGSGTSGVLRTRQVGSNTSDGYPGSAGKFIGPLLKELSELGSEPGVSVAPGFEYRLDYGFESNAFYATMNFGYPTIGRGENDPAVVFEYPSSAIPSASFGVSGDDFATRVRVLGKESDGTRPTASRVNQALLDAGYPLIDRNFSVQNTTDTGSLGDKADQQLALATTNTGYSLTLKGDAQPVFGTYNIGDCVTLRVRRGTKNLPDRTLRFTGWNVTIDDTGEFETVQPMIGTP